MRKLVIILALVVLVAVGCRDTSPTGDGPTGAVDDSPAEVINFPDQYMNVSHKCDGHGHRVFSHTRSGPPFVIDDPSCGR